MRWALPLGLAALAAVPLIVWLHRQRVRVVERVVPSLAGWLHVVAAPPRRRRTVPPSALLALHVAVAAAIGLALGDPRRLGRPTIGGDVAVIVDTSLSMAAADRWPAARAAARSLVDGAGGRVTVVELARGPRVRLTPSLDRAAARAALDALAPAGVGADVAGAVALAAAVAGPTARLVVVTDGALGAPGRGAVRAPFAAAVEWRVVGGEAAPDNVAVVAAEAAVAPDGRRVVARIANGGARPARVRAELAVDGRPAGTVDLALAADETASVGWRVDGGGVAEVTARRLDGDGAPTPDALPADDRAVVPLGARARQLQFAGPPGALRRAVAALPDTEVRWVGVGTLSHRGLADVSVIHGPAPPVLPPGGALVVDPPVGPWLAAAGVAITGALQAAEPHPIAAGLDLAGAVVGGVRATAAPEWAAVLATVDGRPAIWAGATDGRRVVVLGFDPDLGQIARREAFPALVGRAAAWSAPALPAATVPAGEPLPLPPWPVTVERPDGTRTLAAHRFDDDRLPGLYTLRRAPPAAGGATEPGVVVGVRAGDAVESRLAARPSAELASVFGPPAPDAEATAAAGDRSESPMRGELLALALGLLALEALWRVLPPPRGAGAPRSDARAAG